MSRDITQLATVLWYDELDGFTRIRLGNSGKLCHLYTNEILEEGDVIKVRTYQDDTFRQSKLLQKICSKEENN